MSRPRVLRPLLAAAATLVVVAWPFTIAASAQAPAAPTLSVRPALSGKTTLDKGHYRYDVLPGTAIEDAIEVINGRDAPLEVALYGADLITATGGGVAPRQRDERQLEAGAWITLERPTVSLPPKGRATIPFKVVVPEGAAAGDYPGAVVASVGTDASEGLSIETRAALVVDVRVPGHVDLQAAAGPLHHQRKDGEERFTIDARNQGNVLFTARGRVEVRDGKDVVATVPLTPTDLYVIPGGTATFTGSWGDLPTAGRYKAVAVFDLAVRNRPAPSIASRPTSLLFVPVAALAGAAGAGATVAAAWWGTRGWRRGRRLVRDEARRIVEARRQLV